eukprot:jgi/Botrbrau1/1179/Bobra.0162s0062.1
MNSGCETRPLGNVAELNDWKEDLSSVSPAKLVKRVSGAGVPRVLVCHDMQGGYNEDRFYGPVTLGENADPYVFRHWNLIDIFVYFSHHLVTIPPSGWVDAGHRHGVPVLGTLITEWEAGSAACAEMFASPETADRNARQLARIASHLGFDGWLINIENPLPTSLLPNLLLFLRTLRSLTEGMGGIVVWYDALTSEGKLEWQDTLNHLNWDFFDAAGSIFVNYTWHGRAPQQAAERAGPRAAHVFMGVDVYGRGTWGGGGFRTSVALSAAFEAGLSAAIFAPAGCTRRRRGEAWRRRDQQLWDAISGRAGPGPHPCLVSLPFSRTSTEGVALRSFQQRLHVELGAVEAQLVQGGAWEGGSCLLITGRLLSGVPKVLPLFSADVEVPPAGLDVSYMLVQEDTPDAAYFGILLRLIATSGPLELLLGTEEVQTEGVRVSPLRAEVKTDSGGERWRSRTYHVSVPKGPLMLTHVDMACYPRAELPASLLEVSLGELRVAAP